MRDAKSEVVREIAHTLLCAPFVLGEEHAERSTLLAYLNIVATAFHLAAERTQGEQSEDFRGVHEVLSYYARSVDTLMSGSREACPYCARVASLEPVQ